MATASSSDRLEDAFQEVTKKFSDIAQFKMFARSTHGLCLDYNEVQDIIADHSGSVDAQRTRMLWKWKEKLGKKATASHIRQRVKAYNKRVRLGNEATVPVIRYLVEKYKGDNVTIRLEDIFQEEIIVAFHKVEEFEEFAQSEKGLCLDGSDIQDILHDNKYAIDRKMAMLDLWRVNNGDEATVQRIRDLAEQYNKESISECCCHVSDFSARFVRNNLEATTNQTTPYTGKGNNMGEAPEFQMVLNVLLDAVMAKSKMFTRSGDDLLSENCLIDIVNVMLKLWHQKNGKEAMVQRICYFLEQCKKKGSPESASDLKPDSSNPTYNENKLSDNFAKNYFINHEHRHYDASELLNNLYRESASNGKPPDTSADASTQTTGDAKTLSTSQSVIVRYKEGNPEGIRKSILFESDDMKQPKKTLRRTKSI